VSRPESHHEPDAGPPAEHVRYEQYLAWLGRAPEDPDLFRALLADPDRTMATSVVLRRLDEVGRRGHSPSWDALVRLLAAVEWARESLVEERIAEWTLFAGVMDGRLAPDVAVEAGNRVQRALTEADGVPRDVLVALAERGRTRSVRHEAAVRLRRL
jgi:hypothetical protein